MWLPLQIVGWGMRSELTGQLSPSPSMVGLAVRTLAQNAKVFGEELRFIGAEVFHVRWTCDKELPQTDWPECINIAGLDVSTNRCMLRLLVWKDCKFHGRCYPHKVQAQWLGKLETISVWGICLVQVIHFLLQPLLIMNTIHLIQNKLEIPSQPCWTIGLCA